jgi:hypothetical protein
MTWAIDDLPFMWLWASTTFGTISRCVVSGNTDYGTVPGIWHLASDICFDKGKRTKSRLQD